MPIPGSQLGHFKAFTLLEVVVSIGIFAGALLGVVALFTPIAQSVSASAEGEAVARLADALRVSLQTLPLEEVADLLKTSSESGHALTLADRQPDYDPTTDPQILFASRDGTTVGRYSDPIWEQRARERSPDAEKFFEIALIRNEALSPLPAGGSDEFTLFLAYTARVRWPAFVPAGGVGAIQVGRNPAAAVPSDHGSKQVLYFNGAVVR